MGPLQAPVTGKKVLHNQAYCLFHFDNLEMFQSDVLALPVFIITNDYSFPGSYYWLHPFHNLTCVATWRIVRKTIYSLKFFHI